MRRCPERREEEEERWCVSGDGCEEAGGGSVEDLLLGVGFWGRGKGEFGVEEVRERSPSETVSSSESLSNDSLDCWTPLRPPGGRRERERGRGGGGGEGNHRVAR